MTTLPPALQSLLGDFEPAIREMARELDGTALVEAAHRQYEFVMAWTPLDHQDEAHEVMLRAFLRHGIVRDRRHAH